MSRGDADRANIAAMEALPDVTPLDDARRPARLTLLFSYYFLREGPGFTRAVAAIAPFVDVLLDSGAFSAWAAQKQAAAKGRTLASLDVDAYGAWLAEHASQFWQYITLDVVRDPAGSQRNLERLVQRGLRPMPVFVYPESYDRVPELVAVNPYLAVAGGTDASRDFMQQRFTRVFERSEGRALIHGLAYVKYPDCAQLPLHSVDSSSFNGGKRYGTLARFVPRKGMEQLKGMAYAKTRDARWTQYLVERCNVRPALTSHRDAWKKNTGVGGLVTHFAHMQMSHDMALRGRRYFLAIGTVTCLLETIALVGSMDMQGSPAGATFDYHHARTLALGLIALHKHDPTAALARCVELLTHRTRYIDVVTPAPPAAP